MRDLSSRPSALLARTNWRMERRVVALRFKMLGGWPRIAFHLHLNWLTGENVLRHFQMPRLANIDRIIGLPPLSNRSRWARSARTRATWSTSI